MRIIRMKIEIGKWKVEKGDRRRKNEEQRMREGGTGE